MNQKTSRGAISVSHKINFQVENITRDKEDFICGVGQLNDSISELNLINSFVLSK